MPNREPTPPPPSAGPQGAPPGAPQVPGAERTIAGLRADRMPRVLEPRRLVIPAFLPGILRADMEGFLEQYGAAYYLDPTLRAELITHYSEIGRQARRWQTLLERPPS